MLKPTLRGQLLEGGRSSDAFGSDVLEQVSVGSGGEELVTELVSGGGVRIERIVSFGQSSPEGFWYDQEEDEFVVLLSGSAELEFEGRECVKLAPGEWIDIRAHLRHRVKWTTPNEPSVWLAVFRKAR
jgi:cupin 2 domain-containing protein